MQVCKSFMTMLLSIQIVHRKYFFTLRVYKEFRNWKEAPIDCVALSLYQLLFVNVVKRGMSGYGRYHLKEKYA